MTLTVYNTLTRNKSAFQTIEEHKVRMYCCGITVYDYCHLGHARTCLVWDVVRRYLQWSGYEVKYIQNFTDIDDKILKRASQEGTSMEAVSEKYIAAYFEDMERLGVGQADAYPRATHTLDGIKRLVAELEQKGFAYPAEGDVYYAVRKFPDYGKLSGRKLEDMQAGASGRVDQDPDSKKQYPFDFALWKAAKEDEPAWESPWGNGRPGWHIECSAMVRERLGETIDIHVGGGDLTFPHHENEIAQSEAVTGKPLANYWLHNGMIIVEGKKMSKSLGNFITIRELLDKYEPMAVRLFILQAQYRKPVDFTDEALSTATNSWSTLKEGLLFGDQYGEQLGFSGTNLLDQELVNRFKSAVDDDFNFAGGLAVLFEIAKNLSKEGHILIHEGIIKTDVQELEQQWQTLTQLATVLGFTASIDKDNSNTGLSDSEIDTLVQQRNEARSNKDYAQSDRLRDQLQSQGITLIDKPGGITIWNRD
ncbi:MAG: cysteine--tRNA ligase [Pleurocapsa sp. SU_5_0]|nr:cysteine--tRNA ligase [Pleurocapsa sp. SU_5_0]NJO97552.1 cysteine--tRNA ligase [Pleurocapsa sp. CRU_1_2]NJR46816.1 cysteine--tRNA ligase [Hyellaceae cyanobacterium CSU_1_1]